LYYNPYSTEKTVSVTTQKGKKVDLYDTVSGTFVAKNVTASAKIKIEPLNAAVLVIVPAKGKITYSGNKMLVNGIVVDYNFENKK
jgi:hypothetical protein